MAVENFKPKLSAFKPEDPTENGLRILANIIARKHLAQTAARNLQVASPDYKTREKKNEKLP
jgi:hypothetical protein